jgi:hypothetical protein
MPSVRRNFEIAFALTGTWREDKTHMTAVLLLALACCAKLPAAATEDDFAFGNPMPVTIAGYRGDAMEPFLTRDGRYLIFNNSNEIPSETDLHWAERIDDLTFAYRRKLDGANSAALDAVASVDSDGTIYFVSNRSYDQTLITIYQGHFDRGVVTDVAPVSGLSRSIRGQVNFDVEVSADGSTLYFVDGLFTGGPTPAAADLAVAVRGNDGEFHRVDSKELAAINTSALEYAACISEDQLELFFTRVVDGVPGIYRTTRKDRSSPWRAARHLAAITGFVEAPTIAPGGVALYYHARRNDRWVIERVTRRIRRRTAAH